MDIVEEIEKKIISGLTIPKPAAKADFAVKGWGIRRGEKTLVYLIPNHKKSTQTLPKRHHHQRMAASL